MKSAIARLGPSAYVKSLNLDDADWQGFLTTVESGDRQAIDVVARVRPVADAGVAEALDTAVARALPVAPRSVLELTKAGFTEEALCTSPFIEPAAGVEERYNKAALQALDAMPMSSRPQPVFFRCRGRLSAINRDMTDGRRP